MGVDAKLAVVCKEEEKMKALDELLADKPKEKK